MTDDELIAGFEGSTLDPAGFGHREHLRVAWLYLQRHGRLEADRRLRCGLRALAVRAGRPAKFSEALTSAWVERLDRAAAALGSNHSFDDLLLQSPELLERGSVREVMQSV
jgi:N-formylglutamate deformylase